MKKSIGLLSALVVSTTFIVNCQKAPDKRRVRPSGGSGAQTDVITEKAKLPTKVCSQEIRTEWAAFSTLYKKITAYPKVTDQTPADEVKAMQAELVTALDKCDIVRPALKALGETEHNSCFKDDTAKTEANVLAETKMTELCNYVGMVLKRDHNHATDYSAAGEADLKAKANAKEVDAKFLDKDFKISEEAINMMYEGRTNLGSFLVEGEVKTAQSSLDQAMAASKTVCTAIGKGIAKEVVLASPVMEFTQFAKAEKSDFKDIGVEYNDKATVAIFTLKETQSDDSNNDVLTTAGTLLCLNLPFKEMTVAKLETAFGKAITVAPTKVTTEVTGGTSEAAVVSTPAASATPAVSATAFTAADLAAAQPAGSPQAQHLASGTAQMVAEANKVTAQKIADQKATASATVVASAPVQAKAEEQEEEKEEQPAAKVTLVPATGVSSPAAAAKVEAEGKVTQDELALMKEKAERLEKEAKDAEAEVQKLTAAKAKAEDIDDAKAKARITRESANTAKAEYEAAAKSGTTVAVAGKEF